VYREKRSGHSKKPDYFYKVIEQMCPDMKYLELFAKKQHNKKWVAWGNQLQESEGIEK
jgi:N6-adenosine-specific RNA methylase IME4